MYHVWKGSSEDNEKVQSHQEVPMSPQDPRVTKALNTYCSTLAEASAFPVTGPGALLGEKHG